MMYLHYLCIFGLHNDPFEDCKQWKLLKHVPLSDLNPATERVGWGRGSELFACTVFNLSIYFCLALCFLQSRSHKLFKTPNILKIRFENKSLHRFFRKIFLGIFEKLKISNFFREKSKMLNIFPKIWKINFFNNFQHFRFFAKNVQKCSVFQKIPKKKFRKSV